MCRYIRGIFRRVFSNMKLLFLKLIYGNRLHFKVFENFSVSTLLHMEESGQIIFYKNISTKKNVQFNSYGCGKIVIGDNCFFNDNCRLDSHEFIEIGENCRFGPNVIIYDHDHDIKSLKEKNFNQYITAPISIGKNSWIGAGCIILKGCSIGNNCVIGAGTVLTKSIPDNTIVTQKIEYRYRKVIE